MLCAFELSSRVQEMRLTYWAQHREGLHIPQELWKEQGFNRIQFLADLVLHHDLKQSGFFYVLDYDESYGRFLIEVPGIANLVDIACSRNIDFATTYFPPPRKEYPYFQIFTYDQGLYVWDQQVNEVKKDLCIYQELEKEIQALPPITEPVSPEKTWEMNLSRILRWNRQARQSRTQVEQQRQLIEDHIQLHTPEPHPPEPPEELSTPVRVQVQPGQTLQEALFLALHSV